MLWRLPSGPKSPGAHMSKLKAQSEILGSNVRGLLGAHMLLSLLFKMNPPDPTSTGYLFFYGA